MGKVILGMTTSLDGFVNDRNGSVGRLYPDLDALRQTESLQEAMRSTGAVVMGRHAYDMGKGDFTNYEFQVPIFVVTNRLPDSVAKGENAKLRFEFVTGGVESAVNRAKIAAGERNVAVIGGPNVAQQCLRAGLLDEVHIAIRPLLLGEGLRLFEHLDTALREFEILRVLESPSMTEIRFGVRT